MRYRPECKNQNQGFSLLEVLVAVTVLGILLGTIITLYSGAMKSLRVSQEVSHALQLAKNGMEEALLMKPLETGQEKGSFTGGFDWEKTIQPTILTEEEMAEEEDKTFPFKLYDIEFKVRWDSGGKERGTSLKSKIIVEEENDHLILQK